MSLKKKMKKEVMSFIYYYSCICMSSGLVIILFHDNFLQYVARMTLKKLTD